MQAASLNGRPLDRAWFYERDLKRLELRMGSTPNATWATGRAQRPPSVSDAPLSAFGCR